MPVKCEQPLDELSVQVWLLYDYPNFKYCTLFVSGTELRTDRWTDRRTDRQTDDPNTRCPRRTFQAGGIKTFWKSFVSYSELLSKFCEVPFQEYVSEGISHSIFCRDVVYKLRRVKGAANFVSLGSKTVKRIRQRKSDPVIIARTIGLVLNPSKALFRYFLERFTLTNKAVGIIWRNLSKPPLMRQGPDPRSLIVSRDSFSPWTWAPLQFRRSIPFSGWWHYIFLIYYLYHCTCLCTDFMTLCFGWLLVRGHY